MELIGLASDHAGYNLKCFIKEYLVGRGLEVRDFGCASSESCDYPDFAHALGFAMDDLEVNKGIVFCGSGNGINMTINKHPSVRSALCWSEDIAHLARHHNDANVCSLPARFISNEDAIRIINIFLADSFDNDRHTRRIAKIPLAKRLGS